MEKEAEDLMTDALSKNFIDYEEYPQTADIQNRCCAMLARLYHAPTHSDDDNAMGTRSVISCRRSSSVSKRRLQYCWKQ